MTLLSSYGGAMSSRPHLSFMPAIPVLDRCADLACYPKQVATLDGCARGRLR